MSIRALPLLLTLVILLINPNWHILEAALILKQYLSQVLSSTQLYLPRGKGGIIGRDRYESVSSPSESAYTDPRVLQIWFDVLTEILANPLLEDNTGLDPRG